jgi:hypothetical protein
MCSIKAGNLIVINQKVRYQKRNHILCKILVTQAFKTQDALHMTLVLQVRMTLQLFFQICNIADF